MSNTNRRPRWWLVLVVPAVVGASVVGCQLLSDRLSKWKMLDEKALEDPVQAVGGRATVFAPAGDDRGRSRRQLASASPQELVSYYSPVFIQQRVDTAAQRHPYPPEYDEIGEAHVRHEPKGELKSFVGGQPKVYALYEKRKLGSGDHVQLTYTAWYPAHPRMKTIDLEEADIDSCVVRVTLDAENAPLFYETIAACGCFHKVFVQRRVEEGAATTFGAPEKGKKYSIERGVKGEIDWEVAGVVDEPRDGARRPAVFIKAGDHKVLGLGSTARLRIPQNADRRPYALADYSDLYALTVDGGTEEAPFFDLGGKVRGAQRKERFIFSFIGVDDAGQPRSVDQIKLHFDQSTWSDPTIYERFLRLPPGTL
jgi:hypothetical protein